MAATGFESEGEKKADEAEYATGVLAGYAKDAAGVENGVDISMPSFFNGMTSPGPPHTHSSK